MISNALKIRLDTFVDAIIAIIITIMALELPAASWSDHEHILSFFLAVAVYAVSFCFVANIWYQQATLFSTVDVIPRRVVLLEFLLTFLLSLVPPLTRLMSGDVENLSVMLYGALYLLITLVFRYITETVVHQQTDDKERMHQIYTSVYGQHNMENSFLLAALIILAFFLPWVAYVLYIIIPIRSFLTIDDDQRELTAIGDMEAAGQKTYLQMNHKQQERFRHLVGHYVRDTRRAQNDTAKKAAWNTFTQAVQTQVGIDPEQLSKWFQPNSRNAYHQDINQYRNSRRPKKTHDTTD
ncbi:TMEM175 family protein [Lacticaseibacillus saniviri]|uniref:Integral membrane protein n=1 Tax=Lacticaseibacillus saniviri JCM 17471 = DSM 24301 TaxID=1293598 RepID=A0A0R2MW37_9LACO|nr:TMEM175 family protein [Lacticaseibacillus saniviri]KRO17838.1 integral membrane protein [Lacticaseibacillus saniviri JCM 17471 = DSM 24301]MCG4282081.1 TMEM175 family protein [Lacticaseibacillus saniviri]